MVIASLLCPYSIGLDIIDELTEKGWMKIKEIIEDSLIPSEENEEEAIEEENTLEAVLKKYLAKRKKLKKYSSIDEEINEYKVLR